MKTFIALSLFSLGVLVGCTKFDAKSTQSESISTDMSQAGLTGIGVNKTIETITLGQASYQPLGDVHGSAGARLNSYINLGGEARPVSVDLSALESQTGGAKTLSGMTTHYAYRLDFKCLNVQKCQRFAILLTVYPRFILVDSSNQVITQSNSSEMGTAQLGLILEKSPQELGPQTLGKYVNPRVTSAADLAIRAGL